MTSEQPPDQAAAPADEAAVAGRERLSEQVARTGMFGTETTGDTSGYGGLMIRRPPALSSPRPYGSYFDDLADAFGVDEVGGLLAVVGAAIGVGVAVGVAVARASTDAPPPLPTPV